MNPTTSAAQTPIQHSLRPDRVTYIDPARARLLKAFERKGYHGLVTEIFRLEKDFAPKPKDSRLLHNPQARQVAMALLWQVDRKMLVSLLKNQFTAEAIEDPNNVPDWCKPKKRHWKIPAMNCGIYINKICTAKGYGLTVKEYKQFALAMRAAGNGDQATWTLADKEYAALGHKLPFMSSLKSGPLKEATDPLYIPISHPDLKAFWHSGLSHEYMRRVTG